MEAHELKQKRKLIQSAVVYTIVSISIFLYGWLYLFDQYTILFQEGASVTQTHDNLLKVKKDGLDAENLRTVLDGIIKNTATVSAYYKDMGKLKDAIKKPEGVTLGYDEWLLSEAGKKTQLDDAIKHNNDVIGNIIPIFSQKDITALDSSSVNNLITFKTFIDYIEKNLLQKYQIESYSSLGLGSIEFDKDKSKIASEIGSFKVTLQIKGTNGNIKAFLNAIQSSGKLMIQDGKLVSPVAIQNNGKFSGLSNLLMTIDSLKLTKALGASDAEENDGSVDIRFYVRSLGLQELIVLRSRLMSKYTEVMKNISTYSDCKRLAKVCASTDGSRSVGAIKSLQRDIDSLK